MQVMVVDGHVTCPHCQKLITVAQNKSIGAQYAKDWIKLHPIHINFLTWWVSDPQKHHKRFTKAELLYDFRNDTGIRVSDDSFNARISELLSAGTKWGHPLLTRTVNEKDSPHHTSGAPQYSVNIVRVTNVLGEGGVLQ